MEMDVVRLGRGVQTDGNAHYPERDRAAPDRSRRACGCGPCFARSLWRHTWHQEYLSIDSVRAVGGLASRPLGGRLACCLECAAQGIGEPALTGDEGGDLGNGRLVATGGGGLVGERP